MEKQFDKLYARDSSGRINQWHTLVQQMSDAVIIIIHEGLIDGKKTSTSRAVKSGKNIGKMNETSPFEQACKEAESRWTKKKKQGYKSLLDLGVKTINN